MIDFGIVEPGTTLYIPFATYDSNDPSASVTLTGLATTDIEVFKNGGATARASDSGYALLDTDGIDFASITGVHGLSINLADNTTAGFWAAGAQYWVVVSSITVDAATINFIAATFRIGYRDAVLNTTISGAPGSQTSFVLAAGPAEDDALNGCVVLIHDVASAVQKGFAVVSDYTGASKTVTLTAATTFTIADTDNVSFFQPVNANWAGSVGYSTTRGLAGTALPNAAAEAAGGLYTRGTGAGQINQAANGQIDANAVSWAGAATATNDVALATAPTNFATLAIDGSGQVTVGALAAGAITAAAIANGAIDAATFAADVDAEILSYLVDDATRIDASALNTASAAVGSNGSGLTEAGGTGDHLTAVPWNAAWDAEVQSEVEDGLVAHRLDELLNADSDIDGVAPPTVGSVFHELMSKTAGSFTFDQTTDSLEAIRDKETDIETDTQDIQSRIPAALVGGRIDATVDGTGMETGAIDAILNRDASASVTNSTLGAIINDWENGGRLDLILDDVQALASGNDTYLSDITLRIPAALTAGGNMKSDLDTIKTQTVTCAGGVTIPAATLASTTNITAGTITTVTTTTNLTNAPTAGDFTSTMKTSIETAVQTFMEGVAVTDFTAIPVSTPTYSEALGFLYALGLNKHTCTSTTATIYDSDNNAVGTATVTDDGTTFTRTKYS